MTEAIATNRVAKLGFAAALLLALAFMFSSLTAQADAQGLPAVCEQYPDDPQCIVDAEDGDIDNGGDLGPGGGAGNDGDGTGDVDSAGSLPFTGYPMSPLVMLMLALLITGLATRAYLAARERFNS